MNKRIFNLASHGQVVFRNQILIFGLLMGLTVIFLTFPQQFVSAQVQAPVHTIYFPQLHPVDGWQTTITITNAEDRELSLTFMAHNQSGGLVGTIRPLSRYELRFLRNRDQESNLQRLTLTQLAAGETKTIRLESLPDGTESLQIESDGNIIGTATFQSIDGKKAEAMSAIRETAAMLSFPPLTENDLAHKSLYVFNPNQEQATAEVVALDEYGNEMVRRSLLPIAAMGSRAISISELLTEPALQFPLTIKVNSDHNLAGWQIVASPDEDLVGMPALPAAGNNWVLPVLSSSGELKLRNRYGIYNPGNLPAKLTAEFYDAADTHLLTVGLPDLPAGVTPFYDDAHLQAYAPSDAAYLKLISDQPVQCYETVGTSLGQGLTAILGVTEEERQPTTIEIIGNKNGSVLSAYTWPRAEALDMTSLVERGLAESNWLKELAVFGTGTLKPTGFAPAQARVQTLEAVTYTISGQVTLGGNGRQGVSMNLSVSGAASKTTTTDNTGKYSFSGLTNGTYILKPSKDSYTFDPTNSSVTVLGGNIANKNFVTKVISSEQPELKAPWAGKAKISQGNHGSRSHNVCGKRSLDSSDCAWENTYALDISMNNQDILAPASGVISFIKDDLGSCKSGCSGGREMGLKVTGANGKPFEIIFLHLSAFKKKVGDNVKQGDVIAMSGSSSNNSETGTSPHLHMHIWDTGIGSRDSHTMPMSRLWMKRDGETNFKAYESKVDGDDDASKGSLESNAIGGQYFWSDQPDYEGFLDPLDCDSVRGWAWDRAKQNDPIFVDIYDGNTMLASRVKADAFRTDLLNAGKGNGKHGFSFVVPQSIKDGKSHSIRVRISGTDIDLNSSPKAFTFLCSNTKPAVSYFKINNDAPSTSGRTVVLNNTATGSPTHYLASESSTFSGASWQAYSSTPSFTLSSGNGTKTVYLKVRNSAGIESVSASDQITLNESIAPTAAFTMSGGGQSGSNGQTLTYTVPGGGSVNISFDAASSKAGTGSIIGYRWTISTTQVSTARSFNFPLGRGTHNIQLTVTNSAGLTSFTTARIIVNEQATPPTAAFTMSGSSKSGTNGQTLSYTVARGGSVNLNFDAASSKAGTGAVTAYRWTISTTQVSTARSFNFPLGRGTHNIQLTVTNSSGLSRAATATVIVTEK